MKLFKSKSGFTLIELLVVIGILAVLAAIAIPSVAGLIDRANVSADKTNANEMTNAIERFASEYELYCQDIASGVIKADTTDFDAAQGRVYNVTQVKTRSEIETLEVAQGATVADDQIAIYRDTKYPVNANTLKAIVENYTKTSSATFDPKQSDMHFWYSPACGVVVVATPDSSVADKNDLIISGMDAKGNELDGDTQWINLTTYAALSAGTSDNPGNQDFTKIADKVWNNTDYLEGNCVWTDGNNVYYSGPNENYERVNYVLVNGEWVDKIWYGAEELHGSNIWTDRKNIYYTTPYESYVLQGDTWVEKVWDGYTEFYGSGIWTDGTNIFYSGSNGDADMVNLVLRGNTWEHKEWEIENMDACNIWFDGAHLRYSSGTQHYLYTTGATWVSVEVGGLTRFTGAHVWSNGTNVYYSYGYTHYVLNGDTWETKTFEYDGEYELYFLGANVWTDGKNYYASQTGEDFCYNFVLS